MHKIQASFPSVSSSLVKTFNAHKGEREREKVTLFTHVSDRMIALIFRSLREKYLYKGRERR